MRLYLVQHGLSHSKDVDPEKGLTEEGKAEVERIAEVAREYGVAVKAIKHSGKKRARQTADIFSSLLRPEVEPEAIQGIKALDDVSLFAQSAPERDGQMIVGHLPFMARLTSYLIIGAIEPPVFKFQNGGIVCLAKESPDSSWIIQWTLSPQIG